MKFDFRQGRVSTHAVWNQIVVVRQRALSFVRSGPDRSLDRSLVDCERGVKVENDFLSVAY